MKNLKYSFVLFVLIISFLFSFCNTKIANPGETTKLDSIDFFIKKMKNNKLNTNERLLSANSALEQIEKSNEDKKVTTILSYKTYLVGLERNFEGALKTSKELLQLSIKRKDSAMIADVSFRVGYYFLMEAKKDSAFLHYQMANSIYTVFNDSVKIGQSLAQMAMIQSDYGDFIDSDINAINAITYLDENDKVYLSAIYNCLAISSKGQFDYVEAVYWYDKAIELAPNSIEKIRCLNNKANSLGYMKEFEKSNAIFENIIKDSIIDNYPKTKARIIDNMAFTIWKQDPSKNVLTELLSALKIREQQNDLVGLATSYDHLSEYFKNTNNTLAIDYAIKYLEVSRKDKSPNEELKALQALIELNQKSNGYSNYARYVSLRDSLDKAELNRKNSFAKIKYDSEKNREDNLQLKITNSKKELQLEKEKTRNIIGAASSGTVVIGLLGFLYYRKQKHRQEKRAEVYKTETRIAKKLHDEVANNMVNIMNKVQYTEDPKEQLLDDLEKVYLLTRDISHQNNSIETGVHFKNSLKNLLTSFNTTTTTIILKNSSEVTLEEIAKDKQIEIYRIMQELMVNMQKHSKATLVAISFKRTADEYFINYSDNGKGVDQSELKVRNGLKNVETRIKSINGLITFETSLNKGFKAFISFKK